MLRNPTALPGASARHSPRSAPTTRSPQRCPAARTTRA